MASSHPSRVLALPSVAQYTQERLVFPGGPTHEPECKTQTSTANKMPHGVLPLSAFMAAIFLRKSISVF